MSTRPGEANAIWVVVGGRRVLRPVENGRVILDRDGRSRELTSLEDNQARHPEWYNRDGSHILGNRNRERDREWEENVRLSSEYYRR